MASPSLSTSRLQVLGAALLFSTGGAAIKACSLTAWQVASFRSGLAAVALALVLPGWRRWQPRTLVVGAAYATTMVLFVASNKLTTAANAIFLQSTAPMYVLLLAPWLLGEPLRRRDVTLTAVLGVGLALFFVGQEPQYATAPAPQRGNVLALASGLAWALTLLGLRWLGREEASAGATASPAAESAVVWGNVLACVACLPAALPVAASRPTDWLVLVYLGLFQIGLAYVLLTRGVLHLPALQISLLLLLEPVLNAVWAWLVHGEQPGPWSLAGSAIILAGTLALAMGKRS